MTPDVQSLLAVQREDLEIYGLEERLAALAPRLAALEKEHVRASQELERATKSVASEEARHREAQLRIDTHRQLVERSQRAYESVTSPREANAAMAQLEQTKRMVDDSEREASQIQGRINEMRHNVADLEKKLAGIDRRTLAPRWTRSAPSSRRRSPPIAPSGTRPRRPYRARCSPSTRESAPGGEPRPSSHCAARRAARATRRSPRSAARRWPPLVRSRCARDAARCSTRENDDVVTVVRRALRS